MMTMIFNIRLALMFIFIASFFPLQGCSKNSDEAGDPPQIVEFMGDQPMTRIGRPFVVLASVSNPANSPSEFSVNLKLPDGIHAQGNTEYNIELSANGKSTLRWTLIADKPFYGELLLEVSNHGDILTTEKLPVRFLPAKETVNSDYIPDPVPVIKNSNLLIGAHACPIWETDAYERWAQVLKHPGRTPALGFYAQENPEVADWETKWAVEHGIDFFIYCWYRDYQGGPVESRHANVLDDALFKSRFQNQMKFSIMWENGLLGSSGIDNEADLMNNLLPFWIENYFKRSNYLVVDNKPVLFIYRPDNLVSDLGSAENVRSTLDKVRQACRDAGFDGLWILGEYRGTEANRLLQFKNMGMDYSFAYCWHVDNNPDPQRAIYTQMSKIQTTQQLGILPQVVTVSQGWSGWHDEGSIWAIPPTEYKDLLRQARDFISKLPKEQLGSRMLLLDNWNEWGEGHYIAPCTEYGFGYLDAVREVFTNAPSDHEDLIPEDIGMGPYESAYREWLDKKRN
ncbi:MAG: glycoside hydrolase family 99-like domain-containing protein [Mangrovibacterium sp.]